MIRYGHHGAFFGNPVEIAGGAFAFDAEPFEKLLKQLLAGGLSDRVSPSDVQFLR
jgi:hypothetical protein